MGKGKGRGGTFDVPVCGLDFGVFDEGFVGEVPVDAGGDVLQVCINYHNVGVRAALSKACGW